MFLLHGRGSLKGNFLDFHLQPKTETSTKKGHYR